MSDYLWLHGLQHTRLPCPSPTPGACSNLCPLSQWYHSTISSSVTPFSSRLLQYFPGSASFPVSHFFTSGGQSSGASASALPINIQDWFPLGLTFKSLPKCYSSKASVLWHSAFFMIQLSHLYTTTGKRIDLTIQVRKQKLELDTEQQTGSK